MRKMIAFLLLVGVIAALAACNSHGGDVMIQDLPDTEVTVITSDEEITSTDTTSPEMTTEPVPEVDDGYLDIICRDIEKTYEKHFYFDGDAWALELHLPADWTIETADSGYTVVREGSVIGSILPIDSDKEKGEGLVFEENYVNGVYAAHEIYNDGGNYRRTFTFTYDDAETSRGMILDIEFSELNDYTVSLLMQQSTKVSARSDAKLGYVTLSEEAPRKILILGNSFVRTSKIGAILQEMIDQGGESIVVEAISIGYATISKHSDGKESYSGTYPKRIATGMYGAVFLCGLFSSNDVAGLAPFVEACEKTGTKLVVFPAHNESASSSNIKFIARIYPDVLAMSWKEEIDMFIDRGMSKWDFCYNDDHDHSNSVAGYIGAHMIYRAIFGKTPAEYKSGTVSMEKIRQMLGDYVEYGTVFTLDENNLYIFK